VIDDDDDEEEDDDEDDEDDDDDDDFSQDVHGFSPMFGIFLREFSEVLIFSR
jgi:hypothetical protein